MQGQSRLIIDELDFTRQIDELIKQGKPQFNKGLRKAEQIAMELARPGNKERIGRWERQDEEWICSVCSSVAYMLSPYCSKCGVKMLNYETEREKYEDL